MKRLKREKRSKTLWIIKRWSNKESIDSSKLDRPK